MISKGMKIFSLVICFFFCIFIFLFLIFPVFNDGFPSVKKCYFTTYVSVYFILQHTPLKRRFISSREVRGETGTPGRRGVIELAGKVVQGEFPG